jgi:phage gp29-like protein
MAEAKEREIPKPIEKEIATTGKDLDIFGGWINHLENPDPVLYSEAKGKGIRLYDEISRDAHAFSVLQTRYLAVVGKEWCVVPAGSTTRLGKSDRHLSADDKHHAVQTAQFVESVLMDCNFDQLRLEIMQAILYGYYGAEIIWKVKNGAVVIDRFLSKHPRRFCFTPDRQPRLLTPASMIYGEPVPDRKFLIFQYGDSDSPYGKGLGQKLWWPIWFKKHGIKFWVIFMEKFSMPTPIGKYPAQAKEQRTKLLEAIDAIRTETGIVIPDTMSIELMEASRQGDGSYLTACEYFDRQISKTVLGQTLTTDVGSSGSYAASQIHDEVRQDIIEADADLLDAYLNKVLIPWIVDYNFPGVINYPHLVTHAGRKPDLATRSQIDKTLVTEIGLSIAKSYFYETYGLPEPLEGEAVVSGQLPEISKGGESQGQEAGSQNSGISSQEQESKNLNSEAGSHETGGSPQETGGSPFADAQWPAATAGAGGDALSQEPETRDQEYAGDALRARPPGDRNQGLEIKGRLFHSCSIKRGKEDEKQ